MLCPVIGAHDEVHGQRPLAGEILRPATPEDREREARIDADRSPAFATCQELIAKRRLQMNLVDVELIHGRERVVFYYLAEQRIDFRELVKDLARALKTRIEMRQIGVRDEAKLLADYGDCGKPVCCNTHLSRMPPVSMKMAKIQKTTLDPAKISGRCGRLKCCLRYEYDTYRSLEKALPTVGSRVVTAKGQGRVLAQEILAQKLVVELDDHRRIIVDRDDILSSESPKGRLGPGRSPASNDDLEDDRRRSYAGAERLSFRDELARVIANDPRYSIEAYAFILEALNQARQLKLKGLGRDRAAKDDSRSHPVEDRRYRTGRSSEKPRVRATSTPRELCDAVRKLGLRQYGLLAAMLLAHWGVHSTSDIGEIVYNLIAAGDLEKTEGDSRSDFDNVFDFETAFKAP